MKDTTPYTVPKEPGRWRAITLAALVHAALLAFFWIGIRWQNDTPATIEAEVWSPQMREAAPTPRPEPKPTVQEQPKPRVVEPPPVKQEIKPDIALEREKKRKEEEKKKRLEEEQRLAQLKEKKRLEDERLAQLKQQEEKRLEKEKAEKAKKAADEKKRQQEAAEQQMLAKAREEEMRRIAHGVTGSGGTGDLARSQGGRTDGGYAQRVAAKIKSNINFNVPESMSGNPAVEYEVNLLPDGSVAGIRQIKSSGIAGFDEAVRRAIEKSQPYPKDNKSGIVPSSFIGIHKPKDQ